MIGLVWFDITDRGIHLYVSMHWLTRPNTYTPSLQDVELGATRLSVDKTYYVPAYNSKARRKSSIRVTPHTC